MNCYDRLGLLDWSAEGCVRSEKCDLYQDPFSNCTHRASIGPLLYS
jgi:hypothetical protein